MISGPDKRVIRTEYFYYALNHLTDISHPDSTSDVSFIQVPSLSRYIESDPIGLGRGIDPSCKPMISDSLIYFCED